MLTEEPYQLGDETGPKVSRMESNHEVSVKRRIKPCKISVSAVDDG